MSSRSRVIAEVLAFAFVFSDIAASRASTTEIPSAVAAGIEELSDKSLEELMNITVVTSSRLEEKIDEAPNVVYVITAQQIRKMGYRSIMDLFASIPGFQHAPSPNLVHPIIRGIQSLEYLTFMINGHIINNILETNWIYGALNLESVDRVEVIVGPGGVFYPAETGTGIINLITKEGATELVAAGGSAGYLAGSASVGGDLGAGGHWQVTAGAVRVDGRKGFVSDDASSVRRSLRDSEVVGKVFPSYSVVGTFSYQGWALQFVHLNQDQTYLQGYEEGATEAHRWDYDDSLRLKNTHTFNDALSSEVAFAVDNKRYARIGTKGKSIFQLDFSQHIYSGQAALAYRSAHNLVQVGVQAQSREHRHFYTFSWDPQTHDIDFGEGATFANNAVRIGPTMGVGAFASEKFTPLAGLDFVVALRGDYDTVFLKADRSWYFSPRAAIVYRPAERLHLKLMYNTATRMPNAFYGPRNLSWGSDRSTSPLGPNGEKDQWYDTNPTAHRASVLRTLEFQGVVYLGPVRVSTNVYKQDMKDFIGWNSPFTNVGDFHSYGLESNVRAHVVDQLDVNLGFMWLIKNEFITTSKLANPAEYIVNQPGDPSHKNIYANSQGENLGSAKFQLYLGGNYDVGSWFTVAAALRLAAKDPYRRMRLDPAALPSMSDGVAEEGYTHSLFVDLGISKGDIADKGIFVGVFARNLLDQHDFVGAPENVYVNEPEGLAVMAKVGKTF
jgi:hypothetical protein